jgi:glycosyltransferase involved in cell wall biosynthesis
MKPFKIYSLQISDSCTQGCFYAKAIGCKAPYTKSILDLVRSIEKAKAGSYTHLLFPCNLEFSSYADLYLNEARNSGLKIILRLNLSTFKDLRFYERPEILVDILLSNFSDDCVEKLQVISKSVTIFSITILPTREQIPSISFLKNICSDFKTTLQFIFPVKLNLNDHFLSTTKVFKLLNLWKKMIPELLVCGPLGHDIYNPQAETFADFEPLTKPLLVSKLESKSDLQFSIVIPVYNQAQYLLRTLDHLLLQDFDRNFYEIIIVDDGSDDDLIPLIVEKFSIINTKFNFTFIHFPRIHPRVMGDNEFRAGIARNLGARYAKGINISFLDSDILVPPNYISKLQEELQENLMVQTQRFDLTEKFTNTLLPLGNINPHKDLLLMGRKYWNNFYSIKDEWNSLPASWKYVCTYGLSMKRETFNLLNGFRKNFISYGFEDTDLGYRFKLSGGLFKLSTLKVYHQYHPAVRSEFATNSHDREKLLRKTAQVFFLNNLDPEIFQELRSLIWQRYSLKEYLNWSFIVFQKIININFFNFLRGIIKSAD